MKRLLIILAVLLVILVVIMGILLAQNSKQTSPSTNTSSEFPLGNSRNPTEASTSTAGNTSVPSVLGGTIATSDFIHNGTTVQDIENPTNYYLAGSLGYCLSNGSCPSGASSTDFNVVYSTQNQSFIISLLQEPLGSSREEAQQFLMNTLGISEQSMCNLKYFVLTAVSVNSALAGENLGFSFCPGAIALPQ